MDEGLKGWGIYDLKGWGMYDLNGLGIYGSNGWGMQLVIGAAQWVMTNKGTNSFSLATTQLCAPNMIAAPSQDPPASLSRLKPFPCR